MATERIEIIVSANGTRRVTRDLNEVGRAGTDASKGVNLLKTALMGMTVGAGLLFLRQQADAYTTILNRLRLVTSSTQNLAAVNDRLFASANRTYASYDATTELYGSLARSTKTLGLSQEQLLGITETMNQAIAISGTDAATAANGLRQLGQGLASGTLRGDELNSVLENMPRLAQAIADGMGITVGQLRAMGAEGKITAEAITSALEKTAPKIAAEFATINPTIASTFTVLMNNVTRLIGDLNQASGVSKTFGAAIMFVAQHLRGIAILAAGIGLAFAWSTVAASVASVIGPMIALQRTLGATSLMSALFSLSIKTAQAAVRSFTATLLANPFTALLVVLTLVIAAIIEFGDQIKVTEDGAVSLKDAFFGALSLIWDLAITVAGAFMTAWDATVSAVSGFFAMFGTTAWDVLVAILNAVKTTVNSQIGIWVAAFRIASTAWNNFPGVMNVIFTAVVNLAAEAAEQTLNAWQAPLRLIAAGLGYIDEKASAGLNGVLDNFNINIPRAQLSAAGQAAGQAISEGVSGALNQDYLGDFATAAINRGRSLNGAGQAAGLDAGGQRTSTPNSDDDKGKKGRGGGETRAEYLASLNRETEAAIRQSQILDNELREITSKVDEVNEHLRDKNWPILSPAEEEALRGQLRAREQENKLAEVRDRILSEARDPQRDYERHLTAARQLLDANMISQEQYTTSLREARLEMLKTNQDAASGLERGLLRIEQEVTDQASRMEDAVTSAYRDIRGPQQDFEDSTRALQELLRREVITNEEYAQSIRNIRIEYLQTKTDMASGLELGRLTTQRDTENVAGRVSSAYQEEYRNANGALQELQAKVVALRQLMTDDPINSGMYAQRLREVNIEAIQLQANLPGASVFDAMRAGLASFAADFKGIIPGLAQAWGNWVRSIGDGFANAIGRAIVYGDNLKESLSNVAKSAMAELISAIVKLGIQWLIMQVIGQASMTAIGATGAAMGAATAAAWAPAAAAVSLATFGANSVPAMAGIATTYGMTMALSAAGMKGFEVGGYTGNGGVSDVAGVVHGQEYVVNANATKKWRGLLELLNAGANPAGYMSGGYVGSGPTPTLALGSGGTMDPMAVAGNSYAEGNISISIDARGAEQGVEEKIDEALQQALPVFLARARKQEDKVREKSFNRQRIGGSRGG